MPQAITDRAKTISPDRSQGQKLKFVPILGHSHEQPAYELLRQETLALVQVTEISQSGSVPELQVVNKGVYQFICKLKPPPVLIGLFKDPQPGDRRWRIK